MKLVFRISEDGSEIEVDIYTQSNITNIIFTPEYTTPVQKKKSYY